MNSNSLNPQLDDIIFESRNKAYGAYALRQAYGKQMKRGIIGGLSLFALLVSSPLIADRMAVQKNSLDTQVIEMSPDLPKDIEKPILPPPPPPPPPPAKQIATVRFLPPVVSNDVETEPPMPKMDDITVNVAAQTQKGENVEAFVNTIEAPAAPPIDVPAKAVDKPETVFVFVEQMPEYKDGMKAMFKYLSDNIKYPAIARENGIEGTVYVGFTVGRDGSIRDVVVKRGIGGGCNDEAVRVVSSMPNWKEGRQNGKPVNVAFTLPIKFALN
jgi:periplasmic protein TonB